MFRHHKVARYLIKMGLSARRAVQRLIVYAGSILIIVPFLLLLPIGSLGQTQPQGIAQHSTNCVYLDGRSTPLSWAWDDQQANTFLIGNTLGIKLRQLESQSANPQPAASSANQAIPPESEKSKLKAVKVCAEWGVTRANPAHSSPLPLTLNPLSQNAQVAQLQVHLVGKFPPGIRKPIWVMLTSSLPTSIPSVSKEIQLSSRWLCTLISTAFLATIYFFLAKAVHTSYSHSGRSPNRLKTHGWRILDPAVISACDYGSASLANLQILWFSLIVTWILAYGWLVIGRLLNPSLELLGLLGISGGVNVLAKSLTSGQQRLNLDNWNWLVEHKFLRKETDIDPVNVAKWSDFVLDRGVLDPSRYQLIIFGFLVGVNLLFGDIMKLETFQIPQFFLLLQGLSSGLYLFGKSVNPNAKDELEAHITQLTSQGVASLSDEDKKYLHRTIESLYGPSALGDELKPPKLIMP